MSERVLRIIFRGLFVFVPTYDQNNKLTSMTVYIPDGHNISGKAQFPHVPLLAFGKSFLLDPNETEDLTKKHLKFLHNDIFILPIIGGNIKISIEGANDTSVSFGNRNLIPRMRDLYPRATVISGNPLYEKLAGHLIIDKGSIGTPQVSSTSAQDLYLNPFCKLTPIIFEEKDKPSEKTDIASYVDAICWDIKIPSGNDGKYKFTIRTEKSNADIHAFELKVPDKDATFPHHLTIANLPPSDISLSPKFNEDLDEDFEMVYKILDLDPGASAGNKPPIKLPRTVPDPTDPQCIPPLMCGMVQL